MNRRPTVSIAMATYNGAPYLRDQLDSLAAQSVRPIELQIGDDGSTDRTEAIVRDFAATAPFPVIFRRNPRRLGYGENFLRTAARCSGEWIAFCDQDDVWLPQKIEMVGARVAAGDAALALVAHNCDVIDADGQLLRERPLALLPDRDHGHLDLSPAWLCAGFRQVFKAALIRDFGIDERLGPLGEFAGSTGFDPLPHDSWIPFLANVTGRIATIGDPLVRYRRHAANWTIASPPTGKDRTFANNGAVYRRQAHWFDQAARTVEGFSSAVAEEGIRVAHMRLIQERDWLFERAALYDQAPFARRVAVLARLVRARAYRRSWSMDARSLLKDSAFALAPGLVFQTGLVG